MSTDNRELRRIVALKLGELERRRAALTAHYDAVRTQAAAADPAGGLDILSRGLAETRFGAEPLHPDLINVTDLLATGGAAALGGAAQAEWGRRLLRELEQGRARAEHAWMFGHLLEEWSSGIAAREAAPEPVHQPLVDTTLARWQATPPGHDVRLLDELAAAYPDLFVAAGAALAKSSEENREAVTRREVSDAVRRLMRASFRSPGVRERAAAVAGDEGLQNEYAGALTILFDHPERFAWPEEGVPLRTLWARNKWRAYVDEDLLTAIFLEAAGQRWSSELSTFYHDQLIGNDGLLRRELPKLEPRTSDRALTDNFFLTSVSALSEAYAAGDNAIEAAEQLELLAGTLPLRIHFERTVAPADPIYVLQVDFESFGPTLPHDFVLAWLERLHMPASWLSFFRSFLRTRVSSGGRVHQATSGMMPDHSLSLVLGDMLLMALDLHVLRTAGVKLVRLLDDVTVVTRSREAAIRAWRAIGEFAAAAGLTISVRKSAAMCLGGPLPAELPAGQIRFGSLILGEDGNYRVDAAAVVAYREALATLLTPARPVLDTVAIYNTYAKFLLRSMAPMVNLGSAHLSEVTRHMTDLHNHLFAPGHGIEDELRSRLAARFSHEVAASPAGCLYWPITAGGLGLFHPLLSATSIHVHFRLHKPEPRPSTPMPSSGDLPYGWTRYFNATGEGLRPRRPAITPVLRGLLVDFVARGRELRGEDPPDDDDKSGSRPENDLGAYWQWVIFAYGPGLLEHFGTFRLLETALVPTQLIASSLSSSSVTSEPLVVVDRHPA